MTKTAGLSFFLVVSIISSAGFVLQPALWRNFPAAEVARQKTSLRFEPTSGGGYVVTPAPYHFEDRPGSPIILGEDEFAPQSLPFPFPFFGTSWEAINISDNALLTFGTRPLHIRETPLFWDTVPAIYALTTDLSPGVDGKVYVDSSPDRFAVTWWQMPDRRFPANRYTLQIALFPDGSIEIAHHALPAPEQAGFGTNDANYLWQTGIVPGPDGAGLQRVNFSEALSFTGAGQHGIVDSGYLHYRQWLHRLMLPLVYILVGGGLLVIAGNTLFLRNHLYRQLDSLLEGVRQVDDGNMHVEMEVIHNDEIGLLTTMFNQMVRSMRDTQAALRSANLKLTAQVSSRTFELEDAQQTSNSIIQNMTEGLVIEDMRGQIVSTNPAFEAMLGYTPGTLLGMDSLELVTPEKRVMASEVNLRRRRGVTDHYEIDLIRKDGSPLQALGIGAPRYLQGEFAGTIAIIVSRDEQAGLGAAMREERWLSEALRDTSAVVASNLSLEEIADRLLVYARRAIPHDAASIMMLDEDSQIVHFLKARDYADMVVDPDNRPKIFPLERLGMMRQMLETKQFVLVRDTRADRHWVPTDEGNVRSYLGAPMVLKGEVVGFISLNGARPGIFDEIHAERLQIFANHASIAVENARLREAEYELAVLQERQRLARDLHDGVSQTLYSIRMIADVLPAIMARDLDKVPGKLAELHDLSLSAISEMRALLLELRPERILETELGELFNQVSTAASQRSGSSTTCHIEGTPYRLPPYVHIALYRIGQEAFSNIVRHARPGNVKVTLRYQPEGVEFQVQDDGGGFNLDNVGLGHFGLQIMRERAAEINARFEIASRVGRGTIVTVAWKKPPENEVTDAHRK